MDLQIKDGEFQIKEVSFSEVKVIWKNELWPGRQSEILPTNPIQYLGKFEPEIMKNPAHFFAIKDIDNRIIGVNSGFQTGEKYFRSRGLFVFESYRGKGLAQILLRAVEQKAVEYKCDFLWSLPRESSLKSYLEFGFQQTTSFDSESYEFGPNCFVCKKLFSH